ncbi:MAG: extracellular solute-binding protein [Acholeplasmataceae bacterium]
MKRIIISFVVIVAGIILVSCQTKKTELVIYSDFGREVVEKETYKNHIFTQFEKDNDVVIRFETLAQADETYNKIDTEQKAGNHTVDLLISHFGTMDDYIVKGYMEDVTNFEKTMTDRTFLEAFDGSTVSGGKRYFFPINSDVYLSYANKTAFETLPEGLTKADIMAGDYTWEDFAEWAAEIGGHSVMLKGDPLKQLLYQIGGMALSNGGEFPKLNDAGNLKAWQDVIAMKDNIHPESKTTLDSSTMMGSGSIVLAFDLMTPIANAVNTAPAKYEVFPGPIGTSGKAGSIAGGHGIGIVKNAPNRELAEKFIKWFTAPEQIVYAALGTIPTLEEATTELGNDPSEIVIKQGLETLKNANVEGLQMISDYTDWAAAKETYDRIFLGIMDGEITLANLQAKLDAEQATLESLLVD